MWYDPLSLSKILEVIKTILPQPIVQIEGPLLLLDQLVLGWDVLTERIFAKIAAKVLHFVLKTLIKTTVMYKNEQHLSKIHIACGSYNCMFVLY